MATIQYILKRLALMAVTFFLVMIIIFLLVRLLPGDPAIAIAGDRASDADLAAIRERLGLNQPLVIQFWQFLSNTVQGDLGRSILMRAPVMDVIASRLPTTLFLTTYAVALSVLIAGPLAFVAALNRGRWPDAVIRTVFQVGLSMPVFYIGLILLTFLAAQLRWFPVGGYGDSFGARLYHLFLPSVAVALYTSAIIMRNLRSAIVEVVDAEYVEFARAKGLSAWQILGRHVLRNALISTVTLLGLSIGNLMSGTLVTETVFAVPGVGRLMLEAIFARDYPLIQGLTLTFAVLVSIVFLLTDLIQSALDPRMRLT
ncbi:MULTISPECIES: ABC transporter permease [Phaeobacter]|uniref:Glutathione transport system permease protein GsiC n=1 Tax=Phaeobacter gallaeciensis TaxID=60890 RepID=A0AAC9ZC05_9RHOB|nr:MULTISPECIES: ABC transporter permease [Phaeobacter]AHD11463.1 ABC-type dipeptide/oligopeptide/nickel transport system, permease component [Phaeobacter gallaeciensis DSM 26640]ATE94727.1 glutathione transport system permease protein GsiC [Phaeobacter gallaeciensis]ATE98999.1 glutathione transport system permease protein GsiC [Phaeobacter gallaeciensis]ATF03391.1 glutathione transport system permease protein GsiC [Phaeobacter gallaeciensis]ATF07771.1 glutathione transport system permease pro